MCCGQKSKKIPKRQILYAELHLQPLTGHVPEQHVTTQTLGEGQMTKQKVTNFVKNREIRNCLWMSLCIIGERLEVL